MKARPILMSAPMVCALLAGAKTQTRRVVKPQSSGHHWAALPQRADYSSGYRNLHSDVWQFEHRIALNPQPDRDRWIRCAYGAPGDVLWVRETWAHDGSKGPALYRADWECKRDFPGVACEHGPDRWRPSIFMPRWASRLTLRITDVRVQRLQDISPEDARDEGVERRSTKVRQMWLYGQNADERAAIYLRACVWEYGGLWDRINGEGAWAANPYVWALTFEVIKQNVDAVLALMEAA